MLHNSLLHSLIPVWSYSSAQYLVILTQYYYKYLFSILSAFLTLITISTWITTTLYYISYAKLYVRTNHKLYTWCNIIFEQVLQNKHESFRKWLSLKSELIKFVYMTFQFLWMQFKFPKYRGHMLYHVVGPPFLLSYFRVQMSKDHFRDFIS